MTRFNAFESLLPLLEKSEKEKQKRLQIEDVLYNNVQGSINKSSSGRMCFSWDYSNEDSERELKTVAERNEEKAKENKIVFFKNANLFFQMFFFLSFIPT